MKLAAYEVTPFTTLKPFAVQASTPGPEVTVSSWAAWPGAGVVTVTFWAYKEEVAGVAAVAPQLSSDPQASVAMTTVAAAVAAGPPRRLALWPV